MKTIFSIIIKWLPTTIITAGLCGLVYLTVQQALRMDANDPQIQMAEDAVSALNGGVLDYMRQHGEERVTWQPEKGVRMATVVVRYDKGFVLAGRSLREMEIQISNIEKISGIAMLTIWAATLLKIALGELVGRKECA
jgi:hypothetical protein